MPILARKTPPAAPEADVVVLDHQVEYDLADAHNWTERHHVKKQVLTYKGKKDNAELKLDYNPVWEEVKLIRATVTNGGQVKEISEKEINLMDAGWVASAPRYPAAKTLVASLPAVEIGSVIEYEYERHKKDRPFFAATHVFRCFEPINRETVKLTAPASLALRFLKDDNGIAVPDEAPAEKRVIVETQERQGEKARPAMAGAGPERHPAGGQSAAVVHVQSGPADHGGELGGVRRRRCSPPCTEAADGQKAAQQRARRNRRRMPRARRADRRHSGFRRQERSAGRGRDATICRLSAITPADRTLSDGYGNTTDRAVLLYALLKEAGLSPEFVLVNYGSSMELLKRFETQYPIVERFDSVLVRLHDGAQGRLSERHGSVRRARRDACGRLPGPAAGRGHGRRASPSRRIGRTSATTSCGWC